jgi:predicted nucleic acid-binding protein
MIVVDSSSIISLAVNCLCPLMGSLGQRFIITPKVFEEIVTKPSNNKRFALESLRIQRLISSGDIVVERSKSDISGRVLAAANKIYSIRGKNLKIIHEAECEVLALAREFGAKAILIDERITRLLIEDPGALKELLSHRNKAKVKMDEVWLKKFQEMVPDVSIIRSSEVVGIAYEKGLLTRMHNVEDKMVLDAALSALKFSGCAITWEEIADYQKAVI